MATMNDADIGTVMPRTDLARPWCQTADPPVQFCSPVRPCGEQRGLEPVVRYGVVYSLCERHRRP